MATTRSKRRRASKPKGLPRNEYWGTWMQGFVDAKEGAEDPSTDLLSNETAIMAFFKGEEAAQMTPAHQRAYNAGRTAFKMVRHLYQAGELGDLENALAGGNEAQRGLDKLADIGFDFVSDPVGEGADLLGLGDDDDGLFSDLLETALGD